MISSQKLRVYPNKKQIELITKTFGCVRFIYNYFLDRRISLYNEKEKSLNYNQYSKELTALKKELPWLKEPDKFSLQNSLKDLDVAYQRFFNKVSGFPNFKSKNKSKKAYKTNFSNNNIEVFENYIKLPKLGKVKYRDKSFIQGKIISVILSQSKSGKYFASVTYEKEIEPMPKTQNELGVDLGLTDFCVLSTGDKISNPSVYKALEQKLAKEQRKLSRMQRLALDKNKKLSECKNYQKQKIKVAKVHEKIVNKRKDFLNKLSTHIVKNHDLICVEDLNIKGLLKNKKLAKSISDVSWSEFIRQLEYKCKWYGKTFVKINKWFPSSKTCNICGYIKTDLSLSDRDWICPDCKTHHDRDINAAINILNEGRKVTS